MFANTDVNANMLVGVFESVAKQIVNRAKLLWDADHLGNSLLEDEKELAEKELNKDEKDIENEPNGREQDDEEEVTNDDNDNDDNVDDDDDNDHFGSTESLPVEQQIKHLTLNDHQANLSDEDEEEEQEFLADEMYAANVTEEEGNGEGDVGGDGEEAVQGDVDREEDALEAGSDVKIAKTLRTKDDDEKEVRYNEAQELHRNWLDLIDQ